MTAIVGLLTFVDTSSACSIVHSWAAGEARGIDGASIAQHLRCRVNILSAMYGIRVGARLANNFYRALKHCKAPLLKERLGLWRQQILHVDRRHAVGRAGEDRHRVDDGRV